MVELFTSNAHLSKGPLGDKVNSIRTIFAEVMIRRGETEKGVAF